MSFILWILCSYLLKALPCLPLLFLLKIFQVVLSEPSAMAGNCETSPDQPFFLSHPGGLRGVHGSFKTPAMSHRYVNSPLGHIQSQHQIPEQGS